MRILLVLLSLLLLGMKPMESQSDKPIKAIMTFKVNYFNGLKPIGSFTPINKARFIVIDQDGEILNTGLSNSKGEWMVPIKVERDMRFPTKHMGTITLVTIAKGFNENIIFNVSVNEHGENNGGIVVSLNPIKPNHRNEPTILNAENIHRLTVFETLDYFANILGLKRQSQIDPGSIQWGPEAQNSLR